jgi:hypothetical protein
MKMNAQRIILKIWAFFIFCFLSIVYCLLPTVSNAQITFEKTFGGSSLDVGSSAQQTSDGGYIITGYTFSYGAGRNDVYLIKTDSSGDTLWTKTFGENAEEFGSFVQQTLDEGYIIVGGKNAFDIGISNFDVYLIKTDGNGLVGVEEGKDNKIIKMQNVKLFQNLPNPFNFRTMIRYQVPIENVISLKIYDLSGRLIETLVDKRQKPGIYQVQWDGKYQSSGVYFYRLTSGDYSETKKLILLK